MGSLTATPGTHFGTDLLRGLTCGDFEGGPATIRISPEPVHHAVPTSGIGVLHADPEDLANDGEGDCLIAARGFAVGITHGSSSPPVPDEAKPDKGAP
ncbi:hypothetical protein GCM10009670_12320 [Citricoccus alkalitolerans]